MEYLTDQMDDWLNGDQELMNEWRAIIGDEPFVPRDLADEWLQEAEGIPELDVASWALTPSATFPDGSDISDTFMSFSEIASQAELNEKELPSMIEGFHSKSMEFAQAGAHEMFATASLLTSLNTMDASITALEGEFETLVAEVAAMDVEIAELGKAVVVAEIAVGEAVAVEEAAAAEVTAAVTVDSTAEAADWWTVIEGIALSGIISAPTTAAVTVATEKHDEAQKKKKEAEESLKKIEDDFHDKCQLSASLSVKKDSKKKRQESLQKKKNRKESELEQTDNNFLAYKMIHKAINTKLWFIKYWLAIKKKTLSRPLTLPNKTLSRPLTLRNKRRSQPVTLPNMKRVKTGVQTIKEGDGYEVIRVIRANDKSERTFKNKEFVDRYGGWNRIAVIWEHVNEPSNELKSLETVKIWASNNGVSNTTHSQCGMWGVIGESAYEIALESVGRNPKLYTFYENCSHTKGKEFQLETYDSVFLCIRSAPYPAWEAACHGYEVQYTCS